MAAPYAYHPPPLFQVSMPTARHYMNLEKIKNFSVDYPVPGRELPLNCINLVLSYLGFVKDIESYLHTCTRRGIGTHWEEEAYRIIKKALAKGGIGLEDWVNHRTDVCSDVNLIYPLNYRLQQIGQLLHPGFATMIGLIFPDGSTHGVILRKDYHGNINYIDPQFKERDNTYPYTRRVPSELIEIVRNPRSVCYFRGPKVEIPARRENEFQLNMTGRQGMYMNTMPYEPEGPAAAGAGNRNGNGSPAGGKRMRKQHTKKYRKRRSGKSLKSVRKV